MSKLRLQVLLFIATVGLIFGFAGLAAFGMVSINVHPVYLLVIFLAISTAFAFPVVYQNRVRYSIIGWLLILLIYRISLYPGQIIQANNAWGALLEMLALGWLVFMAHRLSNKLTNVETVENIGQIMGLENLAIDIDAAQNQIHSEFTRSRHYERPLSMVIYDISGQIVPEGVQASDDDFYKLLVSCFTQTRVSQVVAEELRAMDLVLTDRKQQRLIILCPEIDRQAVAQLIEHLDIAIQRELGLQLSSGSASFPEDGLTFDGLWNRASKTLDREEAGLRQITVIKSERQFINQ